MNDNDRSDNVRLPIEVARCRPSQPCRVRGTCARYQATVPTHGGTVEDFMVGQTNGGSVLCRGYLNSHQYRNLPRTVQGPRHFGPMK